MQQSLWWVWALLHPSGVAHPPRKLLWRPVFQGVSPGQGYASRVVESVGLGSVDGPNRGLGVWMLQKRSRWIAPAASIDFVLVRVSDLEVDQSTSFDEVELFEAIVACDQVAAKCTTTCSTRHFWFVMTPCQPD